jgi:hypothetical protein
MADDIASTYYVVLDIGRAKIRFGGAGGRPWDEQHHDLFAAQLPDQPLVYGEWRQKWAKNGNDFDVEIIDFGLLDANMAGAPDANRQVYAPRDSEIIERLIRGLFTSVEARSRIFPFSSQKGRFLGHIELLAGWIRIHPGL